MPEGDRRYAVGDWVPLRRAFSHVLAIEEARLGLTEGRGVPLVHQTENLPWAPTTREMEELLRETAAITVLHPRHPRNAEMFKLRKAGVETDDVRAYFAEGDDAALEKRLPARLRLRHSAVSNAHMRLVRKLREGLLTLRAVGDGEWDWSSESESRNIVVPPSYWRDGQSKTGAPLGPVPDYSSGFIQEDGIDMGLGLFGVIRDAEILRSDLLEVMGDVSFPDVSGGIFRWAGDVWEVSCGCATVAKVPKMRGMAQLSLLLSFPGKDIHWVYLDKSAKFILNGMDPENLRGVIADNPYAQMDWDNYVFKRDDARNRLPGAIFERERIIYQIKADLDENKRLSLEETLRYQESEINGLHRDAGRLEIPWDSERQRVIHNLDDALHCLSILCPDLVRHTGTYHMKHQYERKSLLPGMHVRGIRYSPPDGPVSWNTTPSVD